MLISYAYAASEVDSDKLDALANAPSAGEAFMMNIGLIVILVGLFYVLLIMPQQRRFKEHSEMLSALKKGDRVVTGGGLVGVIEKVVDDKEVLIDLGNGVKVTALRSMIQNKTELTSKPANDQDAKEKKPSKTTKSAAKKEPGKDKKDKK